MQLESGHTSLQERVGAVSMMSQQALSMAQDVATALKDVVVVPEPRHRPSVAVNTSPQVCLGYMCLRVRVCVSTCDCWCPYSRRICFTACICVIVKLRLYVGTYACVIVFVFEIVCAIAGGYEFCSDEFCGGSAGALGGAGALCCRLG